LAHRGDECGNRIAHKTEKLWEKKVKRTRDSGKEKSPSRTLASEKIKRVVWENISGT